jgi:hypothetical protein
MTARRLTEREFVPDLISIGSIKLNKRIALLALIRPIGFLSQGICPTGRSGEGVGRRGDANGTFRFVKYMEIAMFSFLMAREDPGLRPAGAGAWHLWTIIIPRLSISGRFVRGRVWRRYDGRRWQYREITEYWD